MDTRLPEGFSPEIRNSRTREPLSAIRASEALVKAATNGAPEQSVPCRLGKSDKSFVLTLRNGAERLLRHARKLVGGVHDA